MIIYNITLPDEINNQNRESPKIGNLKCETINHLSIKKTINSESIDFEYHLQKYEFRLSNCEILNFLTHKSVWKRFLASGYEWCLIIENNVKLDVPLDRIQDSINSIPTDWDVFFPYDMVDFIQKNNNNQSQANLNDREAINSDPYFLGIKWGNSIYFLSKKGAQKLVDIKMIKQRLDDEILSTSYEERLEVYADFVDWFEINQISEYEWPERKKIIWHKIIENSQWNKERYDRIRGLLNIVSKAGLKANVEISLCFGSLLGYIRHGGIMPWDDDVDLGVEESHITRFLTYISSLKDIRIGEFIEWKTNSLYYKIWSVNGEKIEGFNYTFPFIDIWPFRISNNDIIFSTGEICKNAAIENFTDISFENCTYKIPSNSLDVLDSIFMDWKTKIRVYSYCHRLEKVHFPPLTLSIQVDKNGRLVHL